MEYTFTAGVQGSFERENASGSVEFNAVEDHFLGRVDRVVRASGTIAASSYIEVNASRGKITAISGTTTGFDNIKIGELNNTRMANGEPFYQSALDAYTNFLSVQTTEDVTVTLEYDGTHNDCNFLLRANHKFVLGIPFAQGGCVIAIARATGSTATVTIVIGNTDSNHIP